MKINQVSIFALAAFGEGLSGGDRIFIEFARRWSKKHSVNIYVWNEGWKMCQRQKLKSKSIKYQVSRINPWCNLGFFVCYFARIIEGIRLGLTVRLENISSTIVYSASEFWMDSLPAIILKLRYSKITWMAAWYQTAPSPLTGYKEGDRADSYRLSAFYFWFMQQPIKPLIKKWADFVLINNEAERKQFPRLDKKGRTMIVFGAVPLKDIEHFKNKVLPQLQSTSHKLPKYDAVFQGRFHPQKGVLELVDIWSNVVKKIPTAKLAVVGDGPLMKSVKKKISKYKLGKNIKLFGYVFDGPKKYKIFSQSKLVVHPAFFDSGGMAAAEAMAFGLPCVGFSLKSYESYYPKGMVKVKINDLGGFADEIVKLLIDDLLRTKIGDQASKMIKSYWSWDKRASEILKKIISEKES